MTTKAISVQKKGCLFGCGILAVVGAGIFIVVAVVGFFGVFATQGSKNEAPGAAAQGSRGTGDTDLDSARKAAEMMVVKQGSLFDKTEIIRSVATRQSEDDKMDAVRAGDGVRSQADVVVVVQFRLGGMRQYATVGCIRTATPGTWAVSIFSTTVGL